MARATAARSGASSPSVELTKTRRRWSGVRIAATVSFSEVTLWRLVVEVCSGRLGVVRRLTDRVFHRGDPSTSRGTRRHHSHAIGTPLSPYRQQVLIAFLSVHL